MIQKCTVLFCDNEHGCGPVTFPDIADMDAYKIEQEFIGTRTARQLRKAAKQAGWGRINGGDYCPACMERGV